MRLPEPPEIEELLRRFREGSFEALARLLSLVENHAGLRREIISRIYPLERRPMVIGVTGAAGVGKSTLVDRLLHHFKNSFAPLAALAFDPSSRFSGGALLGDRVRMSGHELDGRIFIRSMASRGGEGGMGRHVQEALALLAAFGFELVVLETVGAGQGDTEVIGNADLIVVVTAPGLGDEVQAMKAGLLEIADLVVVNKADLPAAAVEEKLLAESMAMGGVRGREAAEVCSTVARDGAGVAELADKLLERYGRLESAGELARRRAEGRKAYFERVLRERWLALLDQRLREVNPDSDPAVQELNPYDLADRYLELVRGDIDTHERSEEN